MKKQHKYLMPVLVLLVSCSMQAYAQVVITGGSSLVVGQSGNFVNTQNLVVNNGANLLVNGTLILKKDLQNQNVLPDFIGPGSVEFTGSVNQTISGLNTMTDLLVNNGTGVTIGGNTGVEGTMALTWGRVTLGSNNLTLGANAYVDGSPSENAMVVPTSSGQMIKVFTNGFTGVFTFPVGDNTGTSEYTPVTLNFIQSTALNLGLVGVNLLNERYPDPGITGNYLNRFWTLTSSQFTGFKCDAVFKYAHDDVTGRERYLSCTKVNPLPWVTYNLVDSIDHQMTATGVTEFGSFTAVKSTTTTANNELANISLSNNGITNCYDATQVLMVAGSGRTFTVECGGAATLVAGQKIRLLPGTKTSQCGGFYPGGYLHAYISTNGIYCGSLPAPMVNNPGPGNDALEASVDGISNGKRVKLYPNPSSSLFTVEQTGEDRTGMTRIEILNLNGLKMKSEELHGAMKYQGSVSDLMPGIYFIKVFTGNFVETLKLVKN
jgi:hypothetical protein